MLTYSRQLCSKNFRQQSFSPILDIIHDAILDLHQPLKYCSSEESYFHCTLSSQQRPNDVHSALRKTINDAPEAFPLFVSLYSNSLCSCCILTCQIKIWRWKNPILAYFALITISIHPSIAPRTRSFSNEAIEAVFGSFQCKHNSKLQKTAYNPSLLQQRQTVYQKAESISPNAYISMRH